MAFKVYLSPSNQPLNTYNGVKTNERDNCRAIANKVKVALERCGMEVKIGLKGSSNVTESNNWGANLHLPIHTNAANKKARGAVVLAYSTSVSDMKYAEPMLAELKAIVLKQDAGRGIQICSDLSEITKTKAICTYVEVDFHDVPEVAKWLTTEHDKIAEAICKGVCKGAGITYKAPSTTKAPTVNTNELNTLKTENANLKKQVADLKAKITAAQNALK
jgi:N-acetylmuramoyl-L-alanine amidase